MESIGIVTLGGRFNYGNRLQNYATSYIWREQGYEPVSLYIDERLNVVRTAKKLARKILGKTVPDPEKGMTPERLGAFDRFDQKMTRRDLPYIIPDISLDYRFFSVGSDQVWNPYLIAYNEDWFFLDFARYDQRVALAPSIGLDSLTPKQARILAKGVRSFPRVSIREKRGADIIRECSGIDAEVVCDPTLVLSGKEWRKAADGRLTPGEPYVFTYLLGGVGSEAATVLEHVTARGQIPVIPLSDRQKPGEPDAGPAEFIDLIDNAAHVVTDSFHAAVFACILQTPLTIVHRQGGASMFSRLEQLSEMLGVEHKVFGAKDYDISRAGDYEGVPEAIKGEREKFMYYLEACLNA